jgi:SAM-dependent methyltransferase
MEAPPDDAAARREALERWVTERIFEQEKPPRGPVRARLARAKWRLARGSERLADRFLDRGLGTSTGADDPPPPDHPEWNAYLPTPWHVLPRALRYLGVSDQDTFVDFGCGKGRAVHQAAKRPFRRVIGVEISPALAESARAGLAARSGQHRAGSVEILVGDAREFQVPDELTIAYLFHPFRDETFGSVLRNIVDSLDRHPRRVRMIYVHPSHRDRVLATGRFRLLKEQRSMLIDTPLSRAEIFESV